MRFLRRDDGLHLAVGYDVVRSRQVPGEMVPAADDPSHLIPDETLGNVLSPTKPRPQNLVLFDRFAPRDTRTYYPTQQPGALFLPGMSSWSFDIDNQTDQTVTWNLISGTYPEPSSMGDVGASGTIVTLTRVPILTDIWDRYLSVRINFAIAPTTGQINVWAKADPRT